MEFREGGGMTIPPVLAPISGLQSQAGWCPRKGQGVQGHAGCAGPSSCGKTSLASCCRIFLSSVTPAQQPDVGAVSVQVSSGLPTLAWFRYPCHKREVGLVGMGQLVSSQARPSTSQTKVTGDIANGFHVTLRFLSCCTWCACCRLGLPSPICITWEKS